MTKPPVIVRHAGPEDEDALLDMYVQVHREGLPGKFPYSYQKFMDGIQVATHKQGGICGIIDDPNKNGRLAALVFLYLDKFWWTETTMLTMRDCYVRREYRKGTGYYTALRQFSEDVRKSCNDARPDGHRPIVLVSSFVNDNPKLEPLFDRLWRRWGKRVGGIYITGL